MRKLVLFWLWTFWVLAPLYSKSVLIIYDGEREKSEAFKSARFISQLLDHFSVAEKELVHVSDYEPGAAGARDYIFVVFEEGRPQLTPPLLDDLLETDSQIIWINMHIERLLEASNGKWGIRYRDWLERTDWRVFYRGEDFPKEDPGLNAVFLESDGRGKTLAEVRDGEGNSYPYALREKNLWYFADSPFSYAKEGGRFLILTDLLHDILGENHPEERKALIRIEDVSPETDPGDLKAIADLLSEHGVPFQVSLIPIFKIPERQYEVRLSDRPDVVSALKDMVRKGGTIVLHGATHQYRGTTAEDYEFWDDIRGTPIPHESPDWADERLRQALGECFANGLYPLSWETPHYAASRKAYETFARYFDTFYDRVMAAELSATQQIFPYSLRLREFGVTVIPENLGYLDITNPDPETLLENAKNLRAVRDGTASFFFHPFVPVKHLRTLIVGMRRLGWEFASLRDFPCNLRTESAWVTSSGGEGRITAAYQFLHRLQVGREPREIKETYSDTRLQGDIVERVTLPKGSLYVLEARDSLPENTKKTLRRTIRSLAARLFPPNQKREALTLARSLVLVDGRASGEENRDQASFESVLKIFGFSPAVREFSDFLNQSLTDYDLLVVPFAAADKLGDVEIRKILDFVERGGILITDGMSGLARSLGFRPGEKTVLVSEIRELSLPAPASKWNPPATVTVPLTTDAVVLAEDVFSKTPLALFRRVQKGKVLFFADLFDPLTPFGISRFPYFPLYLKNTLAVPFNIKRNSLEFYFDPGFHPATHWEKIVRRWKSSGVKIIYAAAWHFYKTYTFDYDAFIDLCHNHGIAVYAWFEFPQVSPLFWENHPEWREKTASGADALCHWRQQMNLFNPAAREAARRFFRDVLLRSDWDGVNIAELNFDTNKGAADPEKFTPMNDDVRKAFKERSGFDPAELFVPSSPYYWKTNRTAFDAFLRFRTEISRDLHVLFLEEAERIRREKARDMEVIVTAMDSLLHPEIVEECGIDTMDIVTLMDKYAFTLQVEDPARSWANPPSRFLDYYEAYKKYIRDPRRLMFDINCLAAAVGTSPSEVAAAATGTELATMFAYASRPSGRAAIYSEHTIHPFDMDLLAFVNGSDVVIEPGVSGYRIRAKEPFFLNAETEGFVPTVNGQRWPFYGNEGISLPSGTSKLAFKKAGFFDVNALAQRIIFEADIRDLRWEDGAYRLTYDSPLPVSLTFSRPLRQLKLDSRRLVLHPERNGIVLPRGSHFLEIGTESGSARAVGLLGYFSSSVFSLAGWVSLGVLLALLLSTRIKKNE